MAVVVIGATAYIPQEKVRLRKIGIYVYIFRVEFKAE
jgi:hypothetical protein